MKVNKLKKEKISHILRLVSVVIVILPIVLSVFKMDIHCDSAYYISMVERICEGYIPYKTLCLGYSPLWFYITAAYKILFNIPNGVYEPYLLLHYMYQILNAYLIFKILRKFYVNVNISFYCSLLYLLMSHWLIGNSVLLETPSIFWGLLSCWLILYFKDNGSKHYFWIGIICCFSFLTKQFGLGFLPLGVLLIFFFAKNKLSKLMFLILGYLLPIIICFLYWEYSFVKIIFSGYGTSSALEVGRNVDLLTKLNQIIINVIYHIKRINPVVLFSLLFIPELIKQCKWKEYLFCICGFGFILQFYFVGGGLHYQLYIVPFSIMIIALLIDLKLNKIKKYILVIIVASTILMSLYSTYYNRVYKIYIKSNVKYEHIKIANWVKENTEQKKTLYIVHGGIYDMYFLTNLLPPNLKTIGYSFGPLGINSEECKQQIDDADYILRFTSDYAYEAFFTPELKEYCEQKPSIYYNEDIVLHINNN